MSSIGAIPTEDCPLDNPTFDVHENDIGMFSVDPVAAMQTLMAKDSRFENAAFMGPFLFFCHRMQPKNVTEAVFANQKIAPSVLYYFFMAVNLEFMTIPRAACLVLPKLAFTIVPEETEAILNALSEAYYTANPYVSTERYQVTRAFTICVLYSVLSLADPKLSYEKFADYLQDIDLSDQIDCMEKDSWNEYFRKELYEEISQSPVSLSFTFISLSSKAIVWNRSGLLKKTGGKFASKKKRYLEISDSVLKFYSDQEKKNRLGEADLRECRAELVTDPKSGMHVVITRHDKQSWGVKFKKGKEEKGGYSEYCLFHDSRRDLLDWCETINFISFVCHLKSLLKRNANR